MLTGISKDRTHEELQELRDVRDQAKATARVSREMAGVDTKRSEAEFLEYATKAEADTEFDALIGLTQKESDSGDATSGQDSDSGSVTMHGALRSMSELKYEFFTQLAEILNSDQSRSVILSGNVHDLFFNGQEYVPLIPFVAEKSKTQNLIRLVYELNGPIRMLDDQERLKNAWIAWKAGVDTNTLADSRHADAGRVRGGDPVATVRTTAAGCDWQSDAGARSPAATHDLLAAPI